MNLAVPIPPIEVRERLRYSDLITIVALALYLPLVLLLHACWYRIQPGLQKVPAQEPAIKVVSMGALVASIVLLLPRESEFVPHLPFAAIALASLGTFYFTLLCVSESRRCNFLLTLLARAGKPLPKEDLAALYGKDYMIEARLGRLITWGVVNDQQGRLFLKKQSFYLYSAFFHQWAKILGFQWFKETKS